MTKHLAIFLAVLGLGALIATSLSQSKERGFLSAASGTDGTTEKNYTVELGENGFTPVELTLKEGDVVIFVNKNPKTEFFWPASDAHPTHEIYRQFDPGVPIPGNQTWTFTFTRAGAWKYHDHLSPYFTGQITVKNRSSIGSASTDAGCDAKEDSEGAACWNSMLARSLRTEGAKGAFRTLVRLYKTEPAFITNGCHRQAHIIGEAAYAEYRRHLDWAQVGFGPETIYCNYGYYHGIFEHLFRDNPGNLKLVKTLCDELEEKLSRSIPRIRQNCYHGAGHGFMPEPPPEKNWGNAPAMTRPALNACDALSVPSPKEREECHQGVYNVLADWMNFNKYGLRFPEPNLLRVCEDQPEKDHRLACYYEFGMRIHDAAKNDIALIAEKFVNAIPDDETAKMVMGSAASTVIESTLGRERYDDFAAACRALPERLGDSCINGLLGGLVAHGEPGKEYKKALAFCASPEFTEEERSSCYRHLFEKFHQVYLAEEVLRLCQSIPIRHQKSCKGT